MSMPKKTTRDTNAEKRGRVKGALLDPETAQKPAREIARLIGVDESTVRAWRAWAHKFVPQPGFPPHKPKKAAKKNAGKKVRKRAKP